MESPESVKKILEGWDFIDKVGGVYAVEVKDDDEVSGFINETITVGKKQHLLVRGFIKEQEALTYARFIEDRAPVACSTVFVKLDKVIEKMKGLLTKNEGLRMMIMLSGIDKDGDPEGHDVLWSNFLLKN